MSKFDGMHNIHRPPGLKCALLCKIFFAAADLDDYYKFKSLKSHIWRHCVKSRFWSKHCSFSVNICLYKYFNVHYIKRRRYKQHVTHGRISQKLGIQRRVIFRSKYHICFYVLGFIHGINWISHDENVLFLAV